MRSEAKTVQNYLKELPDGRCEAIEVVRQVILKNLPKGYKEGMQYGMIGYYVPHSIYPDGYHCDQKQPLPFVHLASQKNYMSLYLFCIYTDESLMDWFMGELKKSGKKLDMGKSCIRFKKLENLPLELIGKTIKKITVKKFIENYEGIIKSNTRAKK